MFFKYQSGILICVLYVICMTLTHTRAENNGISTDELLRFGIENDEVIEDGENLLVDSDDMYPNDEGQQDGEDTPIDKVEDPPEVSDEGSGDKITIEPKMMAGNDDENKEENIILKYVTNNPDVTTLDLSNKKFSAISATMFQDKLENLKSLDLQMNVLATIDKNAFTSLPRLESINLSTNALSTMDTDTFVILPVLQELDLSFNPLELPSGLLFLNSPTLKRLRMAGCNLKQIPENTFDGMTSLEEIDLGRNPIDEETPITASVFAPVSNLSSVILPESSSNEELIKQLCKDHGLLPAVCIESCATNSIPCNTMEDDLIVPATTGTLNAEPNKVDPTVAKNELNKMVSETVTLATNDDESLLPMRVDLGRSLGAGGSLPTSDDKPEMPVEPALEDMAGVTPPKVQQEILSESSKSGVSGSGVNKTIIGLLVGGMVAVIAGILLKKNWSKIRGKRNESDGRMTGVTAPRTPDVEQGTPETIPLKNNNEKA